MSRGTCRFQPGIGSWREGRERERERSCVCNVYGVCFIFYRLPLMCSHYSPERAFYVRAGQVGRGGGGSPCKDEGYAYVRNCTMIGGKEVQGCVVSADSTLHSITER
ncbi:unnamed protein product, partial [Discosporangium mesarthrocarpum]